MSEPKELVSEAVAEIVQAGAPLVKSAEERRLEKMRSMEDELLQTNMTIMRDMSCFRDITPDMTQPPPEWIEELGIEEATKRLSVARAAWLPPKEAPVGLAVSKAVTLGIIRARAAEKAGPRTLNVALVHMVAPKEQFEEKELDDGLQRR